MSQQHQLPDVDHISDPGFRSLVLSLLEIGRATHELGQAMLMPKATGQPMLNTVATDLERVAHRLRHGSLETWIAPDMRRPEMVQTTIGKLPADASGIRLLNEALERSLAETAAMHTNMDSIAHD